MDYVSTILGTYIFLVGVGVPLVVWNKYFDILAVKYGYYWMCTALLLLVLIVYAFTLGRNNFKLYLNNFTLRSFFDKFTLSDYAVLAYLFVAILSTFSSEYFYESFWGNEGRYTGLYLISWYVISYFCISRFWSFKKQYIDLILGSGLLVSLFGITDYFKMDIFKFKIVMVPEERDIFTSTIGNINTYTAYLAIIVALATVLFTMTNQRKQMIFYYVCMVVGFFAIIMGVSDNAFLSIGALFGLLPLVLFRRNKLIFRYFVALTTFFTVIQCIGWINHYMGDRVLKIDSAFRLMIESKNLFLILLALWAIVITWYFVKKNIIIEEKDYGKIFTNVWLAVIAVFSISILYIFYDCNITGNAHKYEKISNYILFNDDWGTHRGYIWRNAIEHYQNFSLWKKIVGYGPETFGLLIRRATANNPYNQFFDSAHNEYLHLLTTVGVAGLAAYLSFIITYIKKSISYNKINPYIIAMCFAVICYSVQAFVNINLPIVTPIFWLLLGMGSSRSIENNK
jgi:hypothetical protein